MHPRAAKISIQQERGRDDITDAAAEHVRVILPRADAGVARRATRIPAKRRAERRA